MDEVIKKDPRSRWIGIEGLQVGFACLTIKGSSNHFYFVTIPVSLCQDLAESIQGGCTPKYLPAAGLPGGRRVLLLGIEVYFRLCGPGHQFFDPGLNFFPLGIPFPFLPVIDGLPRGDHNIIMMVIRGPQRLT